MPPPRALGVVLLAGSALCAVACRAASSSAKPKPAATVPGGKPSASARPAPVSAAPARRRSRSAVGGERSLGVADRGVFSDLDEQVQIALPPDLRAARCRAAVDRRRSQLVLYAAGQPIKVYPLIPAPDGVTLSLGDVALRLRPGDHAELAPLLHSDRVHVFDDPVELPPGDQDGDGIPDPLDVVVGARKAALNAATYDGRYQAIAFPLGDVPRSIGVCTDVVVRALRNAGYDLQRLVHDDIRAARAAYPMVERANPDIDHRRVKTVLPYFERHWQAQPPPHSGPAVRPGDVLFFDTFPARPGAEHVGIASERRGDSGQLLVINNWTEGSVTRPMELLSWLPVTHRFRLPPRRGTDRDARPIDPLFTQLITVEASGWNDYRARLRRFEREPGGVWRAVGEPVDAVIGQAGYGWGRGLHGDGRPEDRPGPIKREGDGRSPAGVFALGAAYGYSASASGVALRYSQASGELRCVDDPKSRHYNRIVSEREVAVDWTSAEHMRRTDDLYELAIVVAHNAPATAAGSGSCIFLHVWGGPDVPVTGCTAMAKDRLFELARWLRPNAAALVALPSAEYRALRPRYGLP